MFRTLNNVLRIFGIRNIDFVEVGFKTYSNLFECHFLPFSIFFSYLASMPCMFSRMQLAFVRSPPRWPSGLSSPRQGSPRHRRRSSHSFCAQSSYERSATGS
jgi:hypothetical protein